MQIVIEISENRYKDAQAIAELQRNSKIQTCEKIIANGTPLPEHGDLIDRNELLKQYWLENATKYGNKDAEQQKHSYSTMMMYEIADMIEDAETIIPATKEEKHCKACKYSDNGMINVESERCKACYYDGRLGGNCLFVPKQTATKEGDGE